MAEFNPRLVDPNSVLPRMKEPEPQPAAPASPLDLLLAKPAEETVEALRRRLEEKHPDKAFVPFDQATIDSQPKAIPRSADFWGPEEDCDPDASDIDYEKLFKGEGFDSFDYVYDQFGRMVGTLIPKKDFDEEQRREDRAAEFAEKHMEKLERRIGHKIEQADTSKLYNEKESFLTRIKKGLGLHKRKKILDDDEYV